MVKSRSEICKDYRKRLKEKDDEKYLRKERERRRKNYVPSGVLSSAEKAVRRYKVREAVKRCREKKKRIAQERDRTSQSESIDTSGYESVGGSAENRENLVVAMQFPNRAVGPRNRVTQELKRANQQLKELKIANSNLTRKLKTEQRRRQRMVKRLQDSPKTPRSKTEKLMNRAGLTTIQKNKVRKEIIFGNVVAAQLQAKAKEYNKAIIRGLHKLIAGKIVKKYKCRFTLGKKLELNKNTITKYSADDVGTNKESLKTARKLEKNIIQFLERDDNSRMQPGKRDTVKQDGAVKQAKVLTDYLQNLYEKFLSENPGQNISFATFCRIRPKHIQLSAFISRSSCLCTKHQNMALTVKTLRREGVATSVNPDTFLRQDYDRHTVLDKIPETIALPQWKRVEIHDREKKKQLMRITNTNMKRGEFVDHIDKQKREFGEHVDRVKTQYTQIRTLKQNLPVDHVITQMDFAENYACRSSEEIQSAYFNQTGVTLHPVVLYYKQDNDLKHKSIVIVSDTLAHNAQTLVTFIDKIVPEIKKLVPNVKVCHYWTDSPTSQYRNKLIFDTVANHKTTYNCAAIWNYFEAGHGKGPCDGLGGTVKRMADTAIKTGRAMIQDATDFFKWATETSTFENVSFIFVGDQVIREKVHDLSQTFALLRPVKGTMKLHAVVGNGPSSVLVKETSCYCVYCLSGERCSTWREEPTRKRNPVAVETALVENQTEPEQHVATHIDINVDDYVAAVYETGWYVGKVVDIDKDDKEDDEIEISFMVWKKELYQWPRRADKIWIGKGDVLSVIKAPIGTGKTKRMFKLADSDQDKCTQLYADRK